MSRKYFGTDGIRGRVGEGVISADFVLRLGNAYGHALAHRSWRKPQVIIGKDTRISNYMFEAALEAGLVAAGAHRATVGPRTDRDLYAGSAALGLDENRGDKPIRRPHERPDRGFLSL